MVSIASLDKVLDEIKSMPKSGVDLLLCDYLLQTKFGFPCAHEIDEHLHNSTPISLDKVDRFWKKVDMDSLVGVEIDVSCDVGNRWIQTWSEANEKFQNANESLKLLMLKRFREIVNLSTTSLIKLEVQSKTRGRPKNTKSKQFTSTKHEKSAFEYENSINANSREKSPTLQ
ncbi:hypothetical protein C2S51_005096 [Perilla frutescens var. frutescens]|nr:hypothetical protein C2S51_005096 [Perilla frutescens var. frutescens]